MLATNSGMFIHSCEFKVRHVRMWWMWWTSSHVASVCCNINKHGIASRCAVPTNEASRLFQLPQQCNCSRVQILHRASKFAMRNLGAVSPRGWRTNAINSVTAFQHAIKSMKYNCMLSFSTHGRSLLTHGRSVGCTPPQNKSSFIATPMDQPPPQPPPPQPPPPQPPPPQSPPP